MSTVGYVLSGAPTNRAVGEKNIRWALRANCREYELCALSAKSVDAATAVTLIHDSEHNQKWWLPT